MSLEPLVDALRNKLNSIQTTVRGDRDPMDVDDIIDEHGDVFTRLDRLEAENDDLREELAAVQAQLDGIQDLGREKTTKEEKIAACVQFATNQANDPTGSRVALEVSDIKGAAGVSRRYAYDLLDHLEDSYAWAMNRKDIEQYGDLQINKDAQNAAVVIDLERLHTDTEAVNKFTTPTRETEASA